MLELFRGVKIVGGMGEPKLKTCLRISGLLLSVLVTTIYLKWEKLYRDGICIESDHRWHYFSELVLLAQIS